MRRGKRIAPARRASPLARARAPIRLAEIKPLVAASRGHRLDRHVTLAVPDPRIRRLVGHPAMSGAIGAALRGLNAAIGEFLGCRVADPPSAGAFADLLEPNLQHLSDLGLGEGPCRLPLARDGGNDGALPQRLGGFRREVQPRRQDWFLNEKSGFPFRTPAFCSVSRGQRRLGEEEYRAPSVTPGVALRPRTQALCGDSPGSKS